MQLSIFKYFHALTIIIFCGLFIINCHKQRPKQSTYNELTEQYLEHIIRPGDTYANMAKWYFGKTTSWQTLADANPAVPANKLRVGDIIRVPLEYAVRTDPMPLMGTSDQRKQPINTAKSWLEPTTINDNRNVKRGDSFDTNSNSETSRKIIASSSVSYSNSGNSDSNKIEESASNSFKQPPTRENANFNGNAETKTGNFVDQTADQFVDQTADQSNSARAQFEEQQKQAAQTNNNKSAAIVGGSKNSSTETINQNERTTQKEAILKDITADF